MTMNMQGPSGEPSRKTDKILIESWKRRVRLGRDAKNTGLSVLHTLYSFELPAFSSHEQFPLTKFWCKLLTSCQVMLPTSHFRFSLLWLFTIRWRVQLRKNRSAVSNLCSFVFEPPGQNELIVWKTDRRFFFLSPHTPCVRVRFAREALTLLLFCSKPIGPLQLAIHVVQNHRAGEQKSHWDMANKRHTSF